MNILFYRYGSICEPDLIKGFSDLGINKGISIGEARGRSEAKKEYEKELASLKAKLAKYEAQDRRS